MTLDEIKVQAVDYRRAFHLAASGLIAILAKNVEGVSLSEAQNIANGIKSALDYIDETIDSLNEIIGEPLRGEDYEEAEEDEFAS